MCVCLSVCLDRTYAAVRNFVVSEMKSDYFVQPPVLNYERIWRQSSPMSPGILFDVDFLI